MLVEDVEYDLAGVGADDGPVDGGAEHVRGVAADAAAEDDVDVAGRPTSRLSAIRASKECADAAGALNTSVRDTSTWRMEISHQYPAR
jgi:hypothetical protein